MQHFCALWKRRACHDDKQQTKKSFVTATETHTNTANLPSPNLAVNTFRPSALLRGTVHTQGQP